MKRRLRYIIFAFGFSYVMLVSLCLFYLKKFEALNTTTEDVNHTYTIIYQLYQLKDLLKETEVLEYAYMSEKDQTDREILLYKSSDLFRVAEQLNQLAGSEKKQTDRLIMLKSALALTIYNVRNNINYIDTATDAGGSPFFKDGKKMRTECALYINNMLQSEQRILLQKIEVQKKYSHSTVRNIKYLLAFFCIITLTLFILMIVEFGKRQDYYLELQSRNEDLNLSKTELEHIAYSASHDLREPLRKIKLFGDRLRTMSQKDSQMHTEELIVRMNASATQMQGILTEFVNLTALIKGENFKQEVNLNTILENILTEWDERITQMEATVFIVPLPHITGNPDQLKILFKSLLDNSLKFRKEHIDPVIHIQSRRKTGKELGLPGAHLSGKVFYCITVKDNGIGFENIYAEKIFKPFQKLDKDDEQDTGKGMGLAIARRIMVNHAGYVFASGKPGEGAILQLIFPAEDV